MTESLKKNIADRSTHTNIAKSVYKIFNEKNVHYRIYQKTSFMLTTHIHTHTHFE